MRRVILALVIAMVMVGGCGDTTEGQGTEFIDLTTALSVVAGFAGFLIGIVMWLLRRMIHANDADHREFRSDIKKLLAGEVPWAKTGEDPARDK